jgi:hypothetical protein
MKPFEESDFLVVFTGEMPSARLIRTWDRVLAYLDYEATDKSPEESYRRPDNPVHNLGAWQTLRDCYRDNGGDERFEFQAGIGECSHVTITRLTHPINLEWLTPEQTAA